MRFKRYQRMLKLRLFIYLFLVLYVLITYFRGGTGGSGIPLYIYFFVFLFVLGAAFFHISLSGYSLHVSQEGIFKEWSVLGRVLKRKKIVRFERVFIELDEEAIKFYDYEEKGAVYSSYSFGKADRGISYLHKNLSFIPIYDFKGFVTQVFKTVGHAFVEEITREIARGMGISFGGNVETIERHV